MEPSFNDDLWTVKYPIKFRKKRTELSVTFSQQFQDIYKIECDEPDFPEFWGKAHLTERGWTDEDIVEFDVAKNAFVQFFDYQVVAGLKRNFEIDFPGAQSVMLTLNWDEVFFHQAKDVKDWENDPENRSLAGRVALWILTTKGI